MDDFELDANFSLPDDSEVNDKAEALKNIPEEEDSSIIGVKDNVLKETNKVLHGTEAEDNFNIDDDIKLPDDTEPEEPNWKITAGGEKKVTDMVPSNEGLNDWKEKAISQGYPTVVVNKAVESNPSVSSYEEFVTLLNSFTDKINEAAKEESSTREQVNDLNKAIADKNRHRLDNFDAEFENAIRTKYNTTAPKAVEMAEYIKRSGKLVNVDMSIYDNNYAFWILCNVDDPIVKDAIDFVNSKWVDNISYKTALIYFTKQFWPDKDTEWVETALLKSLPEHIYNEDSPKEYKAFRAMELYTANIAGAQDVSKMFDEVLGNVNSNIKYSAAYESAIDNSDPIYMAEANASRNAYYEQPQQQQQPQPDGIIGAAGGWMGKVVHLKYGAADKFQTAFKSALGPYADIYDKHRQEINAEKQRLSHEREGERLARRKRERDRQEEMAEIEHQLKMQQAISGNAYQSRMQPPPQQYNMYNDPRYNNYSTQPGMFNMMNNGQGQRMSVPPIVMIITIHIVIALVAFIINKALAIFLSIGFVIAIVGWIKVPLGNRQPLIQDSGPHPAIFILVGYVIAILALVFKFH